LGYTANSYLLYGESQLHTRWESTFDELSTDLSNLNEVGPEEQVVVDSIKTNLVSLRTIFTDVSTTIERNSQTPGGFFDRSFIQVSWSRIEVQNQAVVFDASRLFRILDSQRNQARQRSTTLLFVLVIVFAIYIFSTYLLFFRRTLKSLSELSAGTRVIGSGNLDYTVPEKHKDEVGDLSRAFNRMTTELKKVTASKADLEKEILERIKAEEGLDRERKQLQAVIESLDEAVGVWNADGSLVLINDATAKLYGFEIKEQMLKNLSEYADVQVRTIDGCELPQEEWPPSRVLRGETFSNWELEQFVPSINKRFIGSNSGSPVRDASG
jgi:PAS domain-containing protein